MKKGVSTYTGQQITLASMHSKELFLGPACKKILGASLFTLNDAINTDVLGTFSSEVERKGTQKETALKKCHMGLDISGLPQGIASEGSFGPHPLIPYLAASCETLVFVDKIREIEIFQTSVFKTTNYTQITASDSTDISAFLKQALFPSHGLIVRPNVWDDKTIIFKGIKDNFELKKQISFCSSKSRDRRAHIETDMRAHMNPTRGQTIRKLGIRLFRRLTRLCPVCQTPGWDRTSLKKGRPCSACLHPSELPMSYIWSCCRCPHQMEEPFQNAQAFTSPEYCNMCNP